MRVGFGVGISYINAPILSGYIDKEEEHEAWLWEDGSYMLWNNNEQVIISYKEEQETMIESIKQAMVLWYDIKRQGCTNENMAANPVLQDLSGNGHDATCYNFAWSGMSGVGGFKGKASFSGTNRVEGSIVYTSSSIKLHTTKILIDNNFNFYNYNANIGDTINFIVSGLADGRTVRFGTPNTSFDIYQNGYNTVTIPEIPNTSISFGILGGIGDVDVTIEILAEYPNALVSDGVDDYAQVTGLPLLTKERGYTVIAKRKWLQDIGRNALVSKNTIWQTEALGGVDGAFVIECNTVGTYSFGAPININNKLDTENELVYQTSKSYNGKANITPGDKQDNNHLCIYSINKGTTWFSSIALYSFLLFDRDLTADEIEWVKTNLIEGGTEL